MDKNWKLWFYLGIKKIMPDFLGLQVVEVREQEKIMP